jgi:phosphotriesterase-related protein
MSIQELKGKVLTVTGPIPANALDITLSHEHCLIDNTGVFSEPETKEGRKISSERLSLQNIGYIRYHLLDNQDNLLLMDENEAINELMFFKEAGGNTVIDATNDDIGRDPLALKRISEATGLNIVMGSGYYVKTGQNLIRMNSLSEDDIAEELINDIVHGTAETGVRAGFIGEIGCSWPLEKEEKKVLRAAGIAQKETGAALSIHPGRHEDAPAEIVRTLKEVDADIDHTIICHVDRTIFDQNKLLRLAETGCYLEYDLWGIEGYYPDTLSITDIYNDTQRIAIIKDLMDSGYGNKILISHDICYKVRYRAYGGHGYVHILENVLPAMRRRGVTKEQINTLIIGNPKECFSFR